MKLQTSVKAETPQSATYITIFQITVSVRHTFTFMRTTALDKTKTTSFYGTLRIITELHKEITYSFLVAGHTKFAPDRCFGLIKKSYKVSYFSSIYELAAMVETSSSSGVNKAQLVGTHDGRIIVPVYDWALFLGQYFKKLPNILKYRHFRFSKEEPRKC